MANKTIVRFNKKQAGIEVDFSDRHLTAAERQTLKEDLGLKWHRKAEYWYTNFSEDAFKAIQESEIIGSTFKPTKKEITEMKKLAEEKAAAYEAKKSSRAASKKAAKAAADEELIAKVVAAVLAAQAK